MTQRLPKFRHTVTYITVTLFADPRPKATVCAKCADPKLKATVCSKCADPRPNDYLLKIQYQ